jgi:hypothetical protein
VLQNPKPYFYLYASNIDKLVNLGECKLYEMKSHDYHVSMQTLIPIAYRNLLSKEIYDTLMEISNFFKDICLIKLHIQHMKQLEKILLI